MKKRIFGMLLMGAMVVASMSMFTSCKDYDDDINAQKQEIASLKTALQEQKTSLEAAIAAAKSEASTANATLNTKLTELTTLVGNNKTELENSIKAAVTDSKAYADGVSADALKAAQAYADAAAKEAAATAKAEALEEAKKLTDELAAKMAEGDEANAKALAEKADELVAKISAVDDKLVKLIDAEKEERINALAAVNTQIENIKLQIAALEKFKTEISKKVSDIAKDLDNTKTILEGVKKAAEKNAEDIKKNKEDIAAINTALTVIDGKIAGLEEQVELLKQADVDLKKLITANTVEIAAVKDAYQKADAALKQEFEGMLKNYYTKAEIDEILKGYAKTTIEGYTVPADVANYVETYVAEVKADMENQITETLNAYDQKLAAALVALFGADDAEGAAAADVEMSEEAIEALKELKKNYNNGINKAVEASLNVLKVAQGKQLTSLVFRPDLYLDGIEAVEVLSVKDTLLALVDETKKGLVTELWGVLGTKNTVAVPDSALTTWYYNVPGTPASDGPAYILHGWTADGKPVANNAKTIGQCWTNGEKVAFYDYAPLATANYHVNPTTANLDNAKLAFYAIYPEVVWNFDGATRAVDGITTPVPAVIEKTSDFVENGILSVPFKVNRDMLNAVRYKKSGNNYVQINPNANPAVTARDTYTGHEALIALQATVTDEQGNDTTVTSDYAMLYPSDYEIVALGGKWLHPADGVEPHYIGYDHLWTKLIANTKTVGAAQPKQMPITSGFMLYEEGTMKVNGEDVTYYSPIDAFKEGENFCLDVEYNGSVDLKEQVFTHLRSGYSAPNGNITWSDYCEEAGVEKLAALGLHYEFEAIHYVSGSNRTDEFEHIEVIDGVAYPRSVTEDGKMIAGKTATNEIVGRLPIVRVTLESEPDDNGKQKVLAVGYILLRITNKNIDQNHVTIELPDGYMNCTAPVSVTWAQVEAQILRTIGMDKPTFEALYQLEGVALTNANTNDATNAATGYNYGYTATPTDATKGLQGRFYSKKGYPYDETAAKPYVGNYGDAILFHAPDANGVTPAGYVSKTAKQYYWDDVKKEAIAIDVTKAAYAKKLLGSVYETVNGERQQTTVLEWNVGSEVVAGVGKNAANQLMSTSIQYAMMAATGTTSPDAASAALIESKGISTQAIEVTVAYKQKKINSDELTDQNAIYVTLKVPATKLHFAYAEIAGKDLSEWYQNNSYEPAKLTNESDAAEIHVNVPVPGAQGVGRASGAIIPAYNINGLQDVDFGKILEQTFKGDLVKMGSFDEENFSKFVNTNFKFHLVAPKAPYASNLNASGVIWTTKSENKINDANNDGKGDLDAWTVKGVTGNVYLVAVTDYNNGAGEQIEILAYKDAADLDDNKNPQIHEITDPEERVVVRLVREVAGALILDVNDHKGTKIAVMPNRYAQDIINYTGRYDMFGYDNNNTYLDSEDKTFTAFFEIRQTHPCYKMFMPNNYFKARFLRPINVQRVNDKELIDGLNEVQKIPVHSLVKTNDWRGYVVDKTLVDAATVANSRIPAKFYGIADSTYVHFWVDAADIRTDHELGENDRTVKENVNDIEALGKARDLESLQEHTLFFTLENPAAALGGSAKKVYTLNYVNNTTNVSTFHLYIPVYVTYSFGEFDYNGTYGAAGSDDPMPLYSVVKNAINHFNYLATGNVAYPALFTPWAAHRDDATGNSVYEAASSSVTASQYIKKPVYTQKVWAMVTVKATTNSQAPGTTPAGN